MVIKSFPHPSTATKDWPLAIGGDLEVESLLLAYSQGIFPWPIAIDYPITWFSPDPRGILFFSELHISRSLKKFLKCSPYKIKFNKNFAQVINNCATVIRKNSESDESDENNGHNHNHTWITKEMIAAYIQFHQAKFAFSVETYLDNQLVGGLYGVQIGHYFCGESMFHLQSNASKVALITLIEYLHARGITWIDIQMVTPILKSLGGREIARDHFLSLLTEVISKNHIALSN